MQPARGEASCPDAAGRGSAVCVAMCLSAAQRKRVEVPR
jgi:hypothetical protein